MKDKTMVIQAIRMVQALGKTRDFDTEEHSGAENLVIYLALYCGFTKEQIFKLRSLDMTENEALNLAENYEKAWTRCFNG